MSLGKSPDLERPFGFLTFPSSSMGGRKLSTETQPVLLLPQEDKPTRLPISPISKSVPKRPIEEKIFERKGLLFIFIVENF